ncbi:MAG: hypothetical protein ABI992_13005, partial [Chthoniobacterales bacterium]
MFKIFCAISLAFSSSLLASNPANPLLYVTQVPMPDEINNRTASATRLSCASAIQNPLGDTRSAGRGGALMLRMPNGTVRNLTKEAGFGLGASSTGNATGAQDGAGIAVQHPFVNWDATRAIFSMAVGAPSGAADTTIFYWQLYEVTNLPQVLAGAAAQIAAVPNQPANYNNLHACYGTNGRIIFTSDQPRGGLVSLYPQRDEYLLQPINTGLWSIDPTVAGGNLRHLVHAPSGIFQPFVDHAGRLLFIQWDHLSRDVEAVTDRTPIPANGDA